MSVRRIMDPGLTAVMANSRTIAPALPLRSQPPRAKVAGPGPDSAHRHRCRPHGQGIFKVAMPAGRCHGGHSHGVLQIADPCGLRGMLGVLPGFTARSPGYACPAAPTPAFPPSPQGEGGDGGKRRRTHDRSIDVEAHRPRIRRNALRWSAGVRHAIRVRDPHCSDVSGLSASAIRNR